MFASIAIFLNDDNFAALQLTCVLSLNLFVIIYIGSAQAFYEKKLNKIDFMNESFVALISLLLVVFTKFVDDQDRKTLAGWIVNIFLCLILVINIILILIDFCKISKLYF